MWTWGTSSSISFTCTSSNSNRPKNQVRIPTGRIKAALVYCLDYISQDSPCQAFIPLLPIREMLIWRDMHRRTHPCYVHTCACHFRNIASNDTKWATESARPTQNRLNKKEQSWNKQKIKIREDDREKEKAERRGIVKWRATVRQRKRSGAYGAVYSLVLVGVG